MKITYKTEIKPTTEQINKIKQNIGTCCWVYNQYVLVNTRLYKMYQRGLLDKNQAKFVNAGDFERDIRRKLKTEKDFFWLGRCDSYARKTVLVNAERAFLKFFRGEANFPRMKKYNGQDVKLHLKGRDDDCWIVQRHRINIPTLGFVKLKEYGYLPAGENILTGTVSSEAGRYYVAVTVNRKTAETAVNRDEVKCSGEPKDEACTDDKIEKIIRKIRREKRSLDRKYLNRSGSNSCSNILKQKDRISKLEQRLKFIQQDCQNKAVKFDKKEG